jgi:hypothetical protein
MRFALHKVRNRVALRLQRIAPTSQASLFRHDARQNRALALRFLDLTKPYMGPVRGGAMSGWDAPVAKRVGAGRILLI